MVSRPKKIQEIMDQLKEQDNNRCKQLLSDIADLELAYELYRTREVVTFNGTEITDREYNLTAMEIEEEIFLKEKERRKLIDKSEKRLHLEAGKIFRENMKNKKGDK
jgi:hypothetical protein